MQILQESRLLVLKVQLCRDIPNWTDTLLGLDCNQLSTRGERQRRKKIDRWGNDGATPFSPVFKLTIPTTAHAPILIWFSVRVPLVSRRRLLPGPPRLLRRDNTLVLFRSSACITRRKTIIIGWICVWSIRTLVIISGGSRIRTTDLAGTNGGRHVRVWKNALYSFTFIWKGARERERERDRWGTSEWWLRSRRDCGRWRRRCRLCERESPARASCRSRSACSWSCTALWSWSLSATTKPKKQTNKQTIS